MGNSRAGSPRAGQVGAGGVAVRLEAGEAAGLGLVAVDREGVVAAAARVGDVVGAAGDGAAGPGVEDVEGEGRVDRDDRVQGGGGLPGLEADAGDGGAGGVGGLQRQAALVAGDEVAVGVGGGELGLEALDGAVGVADGAADGAGLAEDVPGLERLAELEVDAVGSRPRRRRGSGTRPGPRTSRGACRSRGRGGRARTSRKSAQTKWGSMKRSCSVVPQRVRVPVTGACQRRAMRARIRSCWASDMRGSGGISKPRNSTRPRRPVGPSGE